MAYHDDLLVRALALVHAQPQSELSLRRDSANYKKTVTLRIAADEGSARLSSLYIRRPPPSESLGNFPRNQG